MNLVVLMVVVTEGGETVVDSVVDSVAGDSEEVDLAVETVVVE